MGWGGTQGSVHGLNVDKHKALFPAQSTVKPSMLLGNSFEQKVAVGVRWEVHVSSALVVMQS